MTKRIVGVSVGVLLLILLSWSSTFLFMPSTSKWLVRRIPECADAAKREECAVRISSYGVVGDMFGAVNALFSGLAFSAIAIVFLFESRSRRVSRKPLVIAILDEKDGVNVGRPLRHGEGTVRVPLTLEFSLTNQSPDAALNVGVLAKLKRSNAMGQDYLDTPLIRDQARSLVLTLDLDETATASVLDDLTSQRSVEVCVSVTYRSLEGVNWITSVTYELRCSNQNGEFTMLNSARGGTWEEPGEWDEKALVPIDARLDKTSWNHSAKG